jgi:tRNA A58 N-methylase Trm61
MLRKLGYIESVKTKKPCRKDGSPIPWMNYHVIQFLEQRLTRNLSLFEYGSGNSTSFYASLVKNVTSIEMNEQWYEYVRQTIPSNVRLILFEAGSQENYCEIARQQDQKFDVIVVDAEKRVDCLKQAPAALTDTGVIILDDADVTNHAEGIDFLVNQGFRKLDFEGLKANSIRAYRTSVFYRDHNCLGI